MGGARGGSDDEGSDDESEAGEASKVFGARAADAGGGEEAEEGRAGWRDSTPARQLWRAMARGAAGDDEDGAPPESEAARESEFEIWNGDPDEIVAASRKSWPPSEVKGAAGEARKSWPPAKGEGSPPRAEGASPVNAYWWTRKVLAENEVDLDDDHDLDDGKSRV